MILRWNFLLLLLLTAVLKTESAHGQLNVKVGYGLAYFNPEGNNAVLESFNTIKTQEFGDALVRPFSPLHILHGINLGFSYSLDVNHAFEAGWENLKSDKEAVGEDNNAALFQQNLFYSSNQYYLEYQYRSGNYGFGLGLGHGNINLKDEIAGSDIKKEIIKESQLIARFNLAWHLTGNQHVSFSIQPYIHLSFDDLSYGRLEDELGLTPSGFSDSFGRVGLNFIFYNGPRS